MSAALIDHAMIDFPALSLTPPWPWTILHGGKRIENRTRLPSPNYRGPIWLHAAKGIGTRAEFSERVDTILTILTVTGQSRRPFLDANALLGKGSAYRPRDSMLRAGIVGRAIVVGAVERVYIDRNPIDRGWRVRTAGGDVRALTDAERVWWFGGPAYVLDDVEEVPLVPCAGALGLFKLSDGTLSELRPR